MKKISLYAALFCTSLIMAGCGGGDDDEGGGAGGGGGTPDPTPPVTDVSPKDVVKTNSMKVYAHYMPWFVAPESSGVWNHWTMSANPLKSDRSNFASHYHPMTGAYASDDAAILDYQCLLMKYSGIDGVMVDWYGSMKGVNDYEANDNHTKALLKAIDKAKLKFTIVYEDATLSNVAADNRANQARQDLLYLQSNYFNKNCYTKIDGKPLFMCFGPQQVKNPADWTFIFQGQTAKPVFVALNGCSGAANNAQNKNCAGEFLWVNPSPDYSIAKNYDMYIGGAMPGFWDVYKQFGQGEGYTTYDRENGDLLKRQLNAAKSAGLEWLQISTWNDYGEGTTIEPTEEYGYQCLETLQDFTGVSYKKSHLKLIYKWYQLRVKYAKDNAKTKTLEQCYTYFNALMPEKAEELMKGL